MAPRPSLLRNSFFNLAGYGLPLLAALFAVPPLLAGLGAPRFGFLALAWSLVSYFGVFDLGLGRALTKLVADRLEEGREGELRPLLRTALEMLAGLGLASGLALALAAPWLVRHVLDLLPELQAEAAAALRLLALSLPLVIAGAGLRGLLEGCQRFDLVNAVRLPIAVATFLGPVAVLPFSTSLLAVAAVLVAIRLAAFAAYAWLAVRSLPASEAAGPRRVPAGELLRLGGWMTVSNVIAPILLYADRWVVGAVVSVTAVTYYATPFEVVGRLSLVPAAVLAVLFPAFSASLLARPLEAARLWRRSLAALAGLLAVPVALVLLFARPGLALWLGDDVAAESYRVAQILACGVFVHALGQPSFHLLQAAGRPRLTAVLHLLETPLYLGVLLWATARFGIEGAAAAWVLRVSLSATALTVLARRFVLAPALAAGRSP